MRLIKMTGGLGNQMFIYAMCIAMRKRFPNTRIDLSDMAHYRVHNGYELERIFRIGDNAFSIPRWLKKAVEFLFFRTILERKQNLDTLEAYRKPYLWPLVYFKGFYQDERYFRECEDDVRKAFTFREEACSSKTLGILEALEKDGRSVSLHVRRGDYLKGKHWISNGCVCQEGYYRRAIEMMQSLRPDAHFYVFSDDIPWVKATLQLPSETVYVDFNHKEDSWQDMMIMSFCRDNIICNSSFSWWGAWLNSNPSKRIICPAHWQAGDGGKSRIILPGWIRIDTDD